MYRYFFKRLFDFILSLIGLILLAIPMLIIAIAVKLDSKGPAIFKQKRVGKNGKLFNFYKFRSMSVEAPHDVATRYMKQDTYITKVGKFLRKTSLDELPQLLCIIKGDMSIIGPRPVVETEVDLIQERIKTGAYKVRAGLTGLAQINGRDELTDMCKKAQLDGQYAQKPTFIGDMKIFFKTIIQVFKHDGIVEGDAVIKENNESLPILEVASTKDDSSDVITQDNLEQNEPIIQDDKEKIDVLVALEQKDSQDSDIAHIA